MSINLYQDCDDYTVHIYKNHEEWLKNRSNECIGGSAASSLINMNPWRDNNQLWKELKGMVQQEDISDKPYVKFGNDAEPLLRQLFSLDYPQYEVQYVDNVMLKSKKENWMTYSPDGLLLEKETGRKGILEIKTTNILQSKQKESWNEQIPDNYFIQTLWGLLVTKFDFVILKARLRSEWGGEVRISVRHYYFSKEEVIEQLEWLAKESKNRWFKYYVGNIEPPIEIDL